MRFNPSFFFANLLVQTKITCLLLGVFAFLGSLAAFIVATISWTNSERVVGAVTQVVKKESPDSALDQIYSFEVIFAQNGSTVTQTVTPARQSLNYNEGDKVELQILNGQASIDSVWEQFGLALILFLLGLSLILVWRVFARFKIKGDWTT